MIRLDKHKKNGEYFNSEKLIVSEISYPKLRVVNIFYLIEYIFCLFSLTTLPILRILIPDLAQSSLLKIIAICASASCSLIVRRLCKAKLTNSERKITFILVFLFFFGLLFADRFPYFEATASELYRLCYLLFDNYFKYIFLSLFFLLYPIFIVGSKSIQKTSFKIDLLGYFLLANATIIPLVYILTGNFSSGIIYTNLQDNTAGYNGYLVISDMMLFNFFMSAVYLKNIAVLCLGFLTVCILILLGSRGAAIPGSIAILLSMAVIFNSTVKSVISQKFKTLSFQRIIVYALILIAIGSQLNLISPFHSQDNLLSYDNIIDSKVFSTVSSNLEKDESLTGRISSMQCVFGKTFSSPEILLMGGVSIPDGCETYIHSFTSILNEFGVLGFLPLLYLIYLCSSQLLVYSKQLPLLVIMTVLFLLTGLFARTNLSLFLPTLVFAFTQVSGRFKNILMIYSNKKLIT